MAIKFRKKPIDVEAIFFTGDLESAREIEAWSGGKALLHVLGPNRFEMTIETLEGILYASEGTWIIRGVKGEFYPCDSEIFDMTYEIVPEGEE